MSRKRGEQPEPQNVTCPTCGGSCMVTVKRAAKGGHTWDEVLCPTCDGSGRIRTR